MHTRVKERELEPERIKPLNHLRNTRAGGKVRKRFLEKQRAKTKNRLKSSRVGDISPCSDQITENRSKQEVEH